MDKAVNYAPLIQALRSIGDVRIATLTTAVESAKRLVADLEHVESVDVDGMDYGNRCDG